MPESSHYDNFGYDSAVAWSEPSENAYFRSRLEDEHSADNGVDVVNGSLTGERTAADFSEDRSETIGSGLSWGSMDSSGENLDLWSAGRSHLDKEETKADTQDYYSSNGPSQSVCTDSDGFMKAITSSERRKMSDSYGFKKSHGSEKANAPTQSGPMSLHLLMGSSDRNSIPRPVKRNSINSGERKVPLILRSKTILLDQTEVSEISDSCGFAKSHQELPEPPIMNPLVASPETNSIPRDSINSGERKVPLTLRSKMIMSHQTEVSEMSDSYGFAKSHQELPGPLIINPLEGSPKINNIPGSIRNETKMTILNQPMSSPEMHSVPRSMRNSSLNSDAGKDTLTLRSEKKMVSESSEMSDSYGFAKKPQELPDPPILGPLVDSPGINIIPHSIRSETKMSEPSETSDSYGFAKGHQGKPSGASIHRDAPVHGKQTYRPSPESRAAGGSAREMMERKLLPINPHFHNLCEENIAHKNAQTMPTGEDSYEHDQRGPVGEIGFVSAWPGMAVNPPSVVASELSNPSAVKYIHAHHAINLPPETFSVGANRAAPPGSIYLGDSVSTTEQASSENKSSDSSSRRKSCCFMKVAVTIILLAVVFAIVFLSIILYDKYESEKQLANAAPTPYPVADNIGIIGDALPNSDPPIETPSISPTSWSADLSPTESPTETFSESPSDLAPTESPSTALPNLHTSSPSPTRTGESPPSASIPAPTREPTRKPSARPTKPPTPRPSTLEPTKPPTAAPIDDSTTAEPTKDGEKDPPVSTMGEEESMKRCENEVKGVCGTDTSKYGKLISCVTKAIKGASGCDDAMTFGDGGIGHIVSNKDMYWRNNKRVGSGGGAIPTGLSWGG